MFCLAFRVRNIPAFHTSSGLQKQSYYAGQSSRCLPGRCPRSGGIFPAIQEVPVRFASSQKYPADIQTVLPGMDTWWHGSKFVTVGKNIRSEWFFVPPSPAYKACVL